MKLLSKNIANKHDLLSPHDPKKHVKGFAFLIMTFKSSLKYDQIYFLVQKFNSIEPIYSGGSDCK